MQNNLISLTWYIEPPIDFEHKQYILFAYLQIVDKNFMKKMLSPHLLYLEKIKSELYNFQNVFDHMKKDIEKNKYVYFNDNKKIEGVDDVVIMEVKDIVDFSIPQIVSRIEHGNFILNKNKQILY
jgi:hypothetical protein